MVGNFRHRLVRSICYLNVICVCDSTLGMIQSTENVCRNVRVHGLHEYQTYPETRVV